ncbi:MAG TPA: hypothetical protein VMP10_02340 [Chloroflexota bacterium]|nr:hypothetical protein [Chloroflexota bacterium]
MNAKTLAVGIAIGLLLGTSFSLFAAEELATYGLQVGAAAPKVHQSSPARDRPRLATSLQPTPIPPRCEDATKVIHQTSLVKLPDADRDGLATYYVLGTIRNTCTIGLEVSLEMLGVADQGALSLLGRGETMALAPGQERAFYHNLGRHRPDEVAALIVVPKCGREPARAGGLVELRRCHELPLSSPGTKSR